MFRMYTCLLLCKCVYQSKYITPYTIPHKKGFSCSLWTFDLTRAHMYVKSKDTKNLTVKLQSLKQKEEDGSYFSTPFL